MALPTIRRKSSTASAPAPLKLGMPIHEIPAFAEAQALLSRLEYQRRLAESRIVILRYEGIARRENWRFGDGKQVSRRLREAPHRSAYMLEQARRRVAEAEAATPVARDARVDDDQPPEVRVALSLLAGESPRVTDEAKLLSELRERIRVLGDAVRVQQGVVGELRTELSYQMALLRSDRHREALRAVFAAAVAFAEVAELERQERQQHAALGYVEMSVLEHPGLGAISVLGSLAETDSQLSHFKRRLEARGVLT